MSENISNDAVIKATGRSWEQWHELLKQVIVDDWSHKEIVSYLRNEYNISHWWAQTITVDYEQFIGRRQVGQTQSTDYQIGVRKTFDISLKVAWDLLMSNNATKIWLGENKIDTIEEDTYYKTTDGTTGKFRVIKPEHHIRLTWKPKEWESPSTLQIRVIPTKEQKTTVAIHHEKLKDNRVREQMREHWRDVLNRLEKLK
jgi:uncharacterized protein YndB with AHSA1/START domain